MAPLNGIFIIPTGLGCALGGDAGFLPGVKLIAACSNNIIVNPNAVNASDINEMPQNALYVEGSTIDRFLEGKLNLKKVKTYNRILMAVNSPITPANMNSLQAGIWGLGAHISIFPLKTEVIMKAAINKDGSAGGIFIGVDELVEQLANYEYDALALQTPIYCDEDVANHYWEHGGVNPWGGIEAIVSKVIAERINKPVAHAPSEPVNHDQLYSKMIVKQSMAPEIISNTYTFCILKGLHRAPHLVTNRNIFHSDILAVEDMNFLVTPHGCWGRPHQACVRSGIPIIVVLENTTCYSNTIKYPENSRIIFVQNYLEAAGVITALSAGVSVTTVIGDRSAIH